MEGQYIQTASSQMNVATSSADHLHMLHIKEEPGDTDVDVGPTVLQQMDSYYGSDQLDMKVVEQENAIKQENIVKNDSPLVKEENVIKYECDDPLPRGSVKGEVLEIEWTVTEQQHRTDVTRPIETELNKCDQCLKTLNSKKNLLMHFKRVHGGESHKCVKCNKSYKCKDYLESHMRNVHNKEKFECMDCEKVYKLKRSLFRHLELHKGHRSAGLQPSNYVCEYCQRAFKRKNSIQKHIISVHATGSYKCRDCDKCFRCERYLLTHITRAHVARLPKQACNICGKVLNRVYLKQHMLSTHSGKRFQCKFCGKSVKSKFYLCRHLKDFCKHFAGSNTRPYTCDYCQRTYKCKQVIREHIIRCHRART